MNKYQQQFVEHNLRGLKACDLQLLHRLDHREAYAKIA
jgi:hypothetical protein